MIPIHDFSLFLFPVSIQWQRPGAHPFHQRGWPVNPRGALPRAPEAMTTATTPFGGHSRPELLSSQLSQGET